MENPTLFVFAISCNRFSEIPHFIFKWKWNTELQQEVGRSCWESLLGLAQQVFLPAVLHLCHPMVCSGVMSSSWAEPSSSSMLNTSSILIFLLIFISRGFNFWFLLLVPFLSGSSVSSLQICVLWWPLWCISPSFFSLSSSLSSFRFFCSGSVWLQPSFAYKD